MTALYIIGGIILYFAFAYLVGSILHTNELHRDELMPPEKEDTGKILFHKMVEKQTQDY